MKKIILISSVWILGLQAKAFVIYGEPVSVGQGQAQTYVDITSTGEVQAVGIHLTEEALLGLSEHDMTQYTLKFPYIVNIPPYTHAMVDWNPHGHEPNSVYTVPHFDFHFYFISEGKRQEITCMGDDRDVCLMEPAAGETPEYYIPTPEGVLQMGWHWVDPRSPEFNGQPFTMTFIYGFYGGHMSFLEPMIALSYLQQKKDFEQEIPTPVEYPQSGYYPGAYSLEFDGSAGAYLVSLKKIQYYKY